MSEAKPAAAAPRPRWGALANIPRFVASVWRTSPGAALAYGLLRLARALLPVATLFVAKLIIDEVAHLARLPDHPTDWRGWLGVGGSGSGPGDRLALLLAVEAGLALLSDALGRAVSLLNQLLSDRWTDEASLLLMHHTAALDLQDLENSEVQDRLDRARRQASGRTGIISAVAGLGQDLVTLLSFAVGVAAYAPALVGLVALALVPAFWGEARFNALEYALSHRRAADRRELDYLRQTGAGSETAKEAKLFGLNSFLTERFRALSAAIRGENRRFALRRAGAGAVLAALGTLGYYAAYAFLAFRAASGTLSLGDLTFLAAAVLRLRGLLEGVLTGISGLAAQALYLGDLFSFLALRPSIRSPANPRPFPVPLRTGIRFEDVGFRYPGAPRWAVRHLDFTLAPHETLALVGENGAGKTTVVKLLTRLYDPVEGRITLDGHDLGEYDLAALRAGIGAIFQDFVRYDLSAGDNIAVGRIAERDDQPRIERAAAAGLADEVVARLADGYAQRVGRRFRGGTDLSGGEWQKIAIARAYMRDAAVLVLDEPTAALDARAEVAVFERFKALSANRAAVLISHRFASVRMADRILVLADGRVESSGTHEALLAEGGRYADLFALQAAGYR